MPGPAFLPRPVPGWTAGRGFPPRLRLPPAAFALSAAFHASRAACPLSRPSAGGNAASARTPPPGPVAEGEPPPGCRKAGRRPPSSWSPPEPLRPGGDDGVPRPPAGRPAAGAVRADADGEAAPVLPHAPREPWGEGPGGDGWAGVAPTATPAVPSRAASREGTPPVPVLGGTGGRAAGSPDRGSTLLPSWPAPPGGVGGAGAGAGRAAGWAVPPAGPWVKGIIRGRLQ